MKSPYDVILKPIITERSMEKAADKKYAFKVAPDANKIEIRDAVEKIFGVKVLSVNTMNVIGKEKRMGVHVGRRPSWKKAIIRLAEDSKSIEFFEGMV
jgi:large subunit ribosomal protein L23